MRELVGDIKHAIFHKQKKAKLQQKKLMIEDLSGITKTNTFSINSLYMVQVHVIEQFITVFYVNIFL